MFNMTEIAFSSCGTDRDKLKPAIVIVPRSPRRRNTVFVHEFIVPHIAIGYDSFVFLFLVAEFSTTLFNRSFPTIQFYGFVDREIPTIGFPIPVLQGVLFPPRRDVACRVSFHGHRVYFMACTSVSWPATSVSIPTTSDYNRFPPH